MNDPLPPSLPVAPARRRGLGCFAKGCLTTITVLMLLGVGLGVLYWLVMKSGQAYFTERQIPTRILEVGDDQYRALLTRLTPFGQALSEGRAATVELSAEDLNTLVAREPDFAPLRGRVFLNIVDGQLVADLSFPVIDDGGPTPPSRFINARATLDASFAAGQFTFALRHVQPLRGEANEGLLPWLLRNPASLQTYSQILTRDFNALLRDGDHRDGRLAAVLAALRTMVLRGDKVVVTSLERPGVFPPPPPVSPVAAPPATE